ncbi:MAG: type II toxin-antitoxin system PemK/MazF family toxin [Chloroflexi bacterium]|nr:type II toxin-antitoxin system PemK/MazF family toxin [Chloroflexota bacterium]
MNEGKVILAALPQANGKVKFRPAIVLREMPPYGDLLICGISSQLHQFVAGFDEMILRTDADFAASGLLSESIIRLGFLMTVSRSHAVGNTGSISHERLQRLLRRLSAHLSKNLR